MNITRRGLGALACAGISSLVAGNAFAAGYPEKSVRLLVGFPAGSSPDIVARIIAKWMSEKLGQSFVVEAKPGAGSNVGTEAALRAAPDGYTLMLCSGSNAWNATLYKSLSFNFLRDSVAIGGVYKGASVLVVHPSVPAKDVAELIALAKKNPGKLNMASNGNGSVGHVYGSLFKQMTKTDMVHVPYRGNPIPDLLDGRTNVYFSPTGSAIEFVRAGKLRALGVTGKNRWSGLPDTPTIGETVAGFDAYGWMGLAAPRGTPQDIVALLNRQLQAALADPGVRKGIESLGGEIFPNSPAEFGVFMKEFTERWGKVITEAGITIN